MKKAAGDQGPPPAHAAMPSTPTPRRENRQAEWKISRRPITTELPATRAFILGSCPSKSMQISASTSPVARTWFFKKYKAFAMFLDTICGRSLEVLIHRNDRSSDEEPRRKRQERTPWQRC